MLRFLRPQSSSRKMTPVYVYDKNRKMIGTHPSLYTFFSKWFRGSNPIKIYDQVGKFYQFMESTSPELLNVLIGKTKCLNDNDDSP